jgi:hypothetical protein
MRSVIFGTLVALVVEELEFEHRRLHPTAPTEKHRQRMWLRAPACERPARLRRRPALHAAHLIGGGLQGFWDREAEGSDGREVDDQLELGRLQIANPPLPAFLRFSQLKTPRE